MTESKGPGTRKAEWTAALVLGLAGGVYAAARAVHEPSWPTDFDQLWHAARALLGGGEPYEVVGPGRSFQWDWPLFYPLPAVILSVPFTIVPVAVARVLFSTLAAGLLGWAIGPRLTALWPLLLSASWIIAISRTQWAPMLLAAAWLPALGFLTVAKPNVGVAALAAQGRRGLVIAGGTAAAALVLAFLVRPGWLGEWRSAVSTSTHIVAPVLHPGGFLLLLAGLRWRRPEARLLLAMALTPHTPSLYDLLLLFYACRTLRESIGLGLLTQIVYWGVVTMGPYESFDAYAMSLGRWSLALVHLPVLLLVLLRPNVSGDAIPPESVRGWRNLFPARRLDAVLLSLLVLAAALLLWLPLVTYR